MKKLTAFIFFSLITSSISIAQSGRDSDTSTIARDTISIPRRLNISEKNFDSLVNRFVVLMEKRGAVSDINDDIILFRLYNTLDWDPAGIPNKLIYKRLKYLFTSQYATITFNKLDRIMHDWWATDTYLFSNQPVDQSFREKGYTENGFVQKPYYRVLFVDNDIVDTGNVTRRLTISDQDFYSQVDRFVETLQEGDSLKTVDDCIKFVRLGNTILLGTSFQKNAPDYFSKASFESLKSFYLKYLSLIIAKLHCVHYHHHLADGFYSEFYGISIAPRSEQVKDRDYYHIIFK